MRWKKMCDKENLNVKITLILFILNYCIVSQAIADEPSIQISVDNEAPNFFNLDLLIDDNNSIKEQNDKKSWSLHGNIKFQSQYTTKDQLNEFTYRREESGLSQARTTLRLNFLAQLFEGVDLNIQGIGFYDRFYHENRNDFSREEFDASGDELDLREAHIQLKIRDNLWFKFGRQVIAFGESDFTQIIDVINPRDQREFGLVDLEDARLPILASRFSYIGSRWGFDVVLTHDFESNRDAGQGADFDRHIAVRNLLTIDENREPQVGFSQSGTVLRGFWSHAHGDITVVLAKTYDQSPVLGLSPKGGNTVDEIYPEITTYGIAANWVDGFWLFKGELAKKNNVFIPRNDIEQQLALGLGQGELFLEKDIVQSLLGIEYSAYQDIQLSTELTTNVILDYRDIFFSERRESILSSRVAFEFYRNIAELEILWSHWLDNDSDSLRITYREDYSDTIQWSVGYIDFLSNNPSGTLYPFRNNDRVFASIAYHF